MDIFNKLIARKFRNIAGGRYEEIAKRYKEFLLLPEEFVLPEISSILVPVDRFAHEIPKELYETLEAYTGASVTVVYITDRMAFRMIEQTLGKLEAEKLKMAETELGERALFEIVSGLRDIGLRAKGRHLFGSKSDEVIKLAGEFDLLVISRGYGSEITKISPISPVVLKIVQHVDKPTIVY
ncbi:universal stress protein [Thermococcus sp. 21S7]|nr:universal stress protein [Thermococcus sp. 21S7]NJE60663.1 universal stress protein [Thermococcus sp. 21S7]